MTVFKNNVKIINNMKKVLIFCFVFTVVSCIGGTKRVTTTGALSADQVETNNQVDSIANSVAVLLQPSKFELPYNVRTNPKDVQYSTLQSGIVGMEKYMCGESDLRYISLPAKNDISVILVPMDCGDFPYRYYLLTIKKNQIVSELYVEGEWWEPDSNEDEIEKTRFSIDKDYTITVEVTYAGKDKKNTYTIANDGKIVREE